MENKMNCKILHITDSENNKKENIMKNKVDILYEHRKEDEFFISISIDNKGKNNTLDNFYHYSIETAREMETFPFTDPEIIFFHNLSYAYFEKLKTNAKKIMTIDEIIMLHNKNTNTFWKMYDKVDEVVVTDKEERLYLKKLIETKRKKDKKVTIIPSCLDLPIIKKTSSKKKTIGFYGNFELQTGVVDLINQMKNINDYTLFIANDISNNNKIVLNHCLHLTKQQKNNIIYVGAINKERKIDFLNRMEIVVLPNLQGNFDFCFEAMLYGKLILVNKTDKIVELLGENYPLYYNTLDQDGLLSAIYRYELLTSEEKQSLILSNHNKLKLYPINRLINLYRNYMVDLSYGYSGTYGMHII